MPFEQVIKAFRFRPTRETVTLIGTAFAPLARTPYRVRWVATGLLSAVDEAQVALRSYWKPLDHAHVEPGTLVLRTAPGGGGTLLVEGGDYLVDYERGAFRLKATSAVATAVPVYATYQYRETIWTRSTDGGATGDYEVDTDLTLARGLRRTAGSAIPSGAAVDVEYDWGEEAFTSALGTGNVLDASFTWDAVGGCTAGALTLAAEPFASTGLVPYQTEIWAYYQAADFPGPPRWAGRLLPRTDDAAAQTVTFPLEGLWQYVADARVAAAEVTGRRYAGDLGTVVRDLLHDWAPHEIVVDDTLIEANATFVDDSWHDAPLEHALAVLQARAAADGAGPWIYGVRPDRRFYFRRRPTAIARTFQSGVAGATLSARTPTTTPVTELTLVQPGGTRYRFTSPAVFDQSSALFGVHAPGTFLAPTRLAGDAAAQFAAGVFAEYAQAQVQLVADVLEDGATPLRPDEGFARLRTRHGTHIADLPMQRLVARWHGTWTSRWTFGVRPEHPLRQRPAAPQGGALGTGAPTYLPFAARLSDGADPSFSFVEIDPDTGADLAVGRTGTARNISLVPAAVGDRVLVQEDEQRFPFFSSRLKVLRYKVELWMDGAPLWTPPLGPLKGARLEALITAFGIAASFHRARDGTSALLGMAVTQGAAAAESDGRVDFAASGDENSVLVNPTGVNVTDVLTKGVLLQGAAEARLGFGYELTGTSAVASVNLLFGPGQRRLAMTFEATAGAVQLDLREDAFSSLSGASQFQTVVAGGAHEFEWRIRPVV